MKNQNKVYVNSFKEISLKAKYYNFIRNIFELFEVLAEA